MSPLTQEPTRQVTLICIRAGEIDGIKLGQEFEPLGEDERNWEIEAEGERYLVSKLTRQVRLCWDSPWFAVSITSGEERQPC